MNDLNGGRQIRWYEVIYVLALLFLLITSVFFMNPHKVGVLDVDRVFKDVGMVQRIEKDRKQLDAFNRGTRMVEAHNLRLTDLNKRLQAATAQAEKDKIQSQIRAANELLQQSLNPIQAALQAHENQVVTTFRRRLQPFINDAARKRRMDVVMFAGPNLVYTRDKVDVTAAVLAACKSYFAKDMPLIDPALAPQPQPPVGNR